MDLIGAQCIQKWTWLELRHAVQSSGDIDKAEDKFIAACNRTKKLVHKCGMVELTK